MPIVSFNIFSQEVSSIISHYDNKKRIIFNNLKKLKVEPTYFSAWFSTNFWYDRDLFLARISLSSGAFLII